jgi:hypothetical protein
MRVSLDRRRLVLPSRVVRDLEWLGAEARDSQRVWRDSLSIFAFMGPQTEPALGEAARCLWLEPEQRVSRTKLKTNRKQRTWIS